MSKPTLVVSIVSLLSVSFIAGAWYGRSGAKPRSGGGLAEADGFAGGRAEPRSGGALAEPAVATASAGPAMAGHDHAKHMAGASNPGAPAGAPTPATINVSAEQQQLIGVRLGTAEQGSKRFMRRLVGRVAPDETRLYRVNMAVDAWVQEIFPVTVGSLVRKDQPLLSYYSPEFGGSIQAYFYALSAMDRYQASGTETPAQMALTTATIQQAIDSLKNLGMGDLQIEELKRTRQPTKRVVVRAPASGFVIARNVYAGQRLERGAEIYRIADLGRVWILADTFDGEAESLRPGALAKVTVPHGEHSFEARVSGVPPQFDPVSRSLKVRLEVVNPGYRLRPDMFVDVELPVELPSALTVPADSVLDSGLRKTVFVDRGKGSFERRAVETGWRFGDRVEIRRGLSPGERIVVAGTFLLDSESRMRLGAAASDPPARHDAAAPPAAHHHEAAAPPPPQARKDAPVAPVAGQGHEHHQGATGHD
jgi:Cu(I)/Ag(I) efflux system membrane fusion protein